MRRLMRRLLAELFDDKASQTKAAAVLAFYHTEAHPDVTPDIANYAANSLKKEFELRHHALEQVHDELLYKLRKCHCCESFEEYLNDCWGPNHGKKWTRYRPYEDKCHEMCDDPDCNNCERDIWTSPCIECCQVDTLMDERTTRPCCYMRFTECRR